MLEEFIRDLKAAIEKEMQDLSLHLINGRAVDYENYKERVAMIKSRQAILEKIDEVRANLVASEGKRRSVA